MSIRIAGAQLPITADVEANLAALYRAIDWAQAQQADVLLTPEGSLSGYTHRFDVPAVQNALLDVTARARETRLGLALGTCFVESDGRCYNELRFYTSEGAYLGFHSKTLTCGSLSDPPRGEIEHYAVQPLRTFAMNQTTVGGLICNDMWANPECTPTPDPHLCQQLARMGARIVYHAVNGGRDGGEWSGVAWRYHEANLRMRARAGHVWVVTVDNCHPIDIRCSSPSGVLDPHGEWVCRTEPRGEQFFVHTIDLGDG